MSGGFETKPNDCTDTCTYDAVAERHFCTNGMGMTVGCYPTEEPLPIPGSNQNQGDFYSLELGAIACLGVTGTSADQVAGFPGILRTVEVIRATVVE